MAFLHALYKIKVLLRAGISDTLMIFSFPVHTSLAVATLLLLNLSNAKNCSEETTIKIEREIRPW